MIEIIEAITNSLLKLSNISVHLLPLLQVMAVIIALAIIGLMIWNGKS
jgi:hypothetical protein